MTSAATAVGIAGLAASESARAASAEPEETPTSRPVGFPENDAEALSADVVVIGAGYAGMVAAISANDAGASVVLLEKLGLTGGSSAMSGGILTVPQAEPSAEVASTGAATSVDDHLAVWFDRTQGNYNETLVRTMLEAAEETVFWLMELGVPYNVGTTRLACTPNDYLLSAYSPNGGSNYDQKPGQGNGGIAAGVLADVVSSREGIALLTDTRALGLATDASGAVTGVVARSSAGTYLSISSKAVVVATGGYGRDAEMIAEYSPMAKGSVSLTSAGTTGDGIRMGQRVGAATVFNGGVIGCQLIGGVFMRTPTGLVVNPEGVRCFDEALHYSSQYKYRRLMDGSDYYWAIYDAAAYNERLDEFVASGDAYRADTLDELALLTGMDAEKFARTVARYNAQTGSEDLDFRKRAEYMTGVGEGPYYAARLVNAFIGTIGGLRIDEGARVLDTSGAAIPGLYAAGETANGELFYDYYAVSGGSLASSLAIGRIAGRAAAEHAL